MFEYLKFLKKSSFHERIILSILYLEKTTYLSFFFKIFRKLVNQAIYHCEIHPDSFKDGATILSLRLPHPFLIIVHRMALIGKNVTLFHNVTIGHREQGHSGVPTISDGVYISTGATVLGDVNVGEGAIIGAGAIVLSDVAKNQKIVGLHK
ncbi:hypothetical protein QM999_17265 [Pectobacterium cacticida]|uniref:hypothetical protein n=1 Tax=Pectobacterium cacticida TaxID=69221 RepID=UPI002FF2604A